MLASIKIALLTFMSLLFGATPSTGVTPHEIGPGRIMRDYQFTTAAPSLLSRTNYYVVDLPVLAYATATGSSTGGYQPKSICVPNPLTRLRQGTGSGSAANLNRGSGALLVAVYNNVKNPAGIGGDVGFSANCAAATASGQTIMNDVCTATGCTTKYIASGSSALDWNGASYVTLTLRDNPTSAFRASLFLQVTDNGAE